MWVGNTAPRLPRDSAPSSGRITVLLKHCKINQGRGSAGIKGREFCHDWGLWLEEADSWLAAALLHVLSRCSFRAPDTSGMRWGHVVCLDFLWRISRIGVPWVREIKQLLIKRAAQRQGVEISTWPRSRKALFSSLTKGKGQFSSSSSLDNISEVSYTPVCDHRVILTLSDPIDFQVSKFYCNIIKYIIAVWIVLSRLCSLVDLWMIYKLLLVSELTISFWTM